MPRDNAGTYTLVAGNPVTPGTVITSTWANNTMSDVAQALTDSLDRQGRGGMLAPFTFTDGSATAPGAAWTQEPTSGFYRAGAGDMRVAILTADVFRWNANGAQIWNTTDSVWEAVLTNGGASALVPVNPGTAEGQVLFWDSTVDNQWKPSSLLRLDVALGRADIVQSPTTRAWNAAASTVTLIERSATAGFTIVGGNINTCLLNFGDDDLETAGQIVYDHLNGEMLFNVEGDLAMTLKPAGEVEMPGNLTVAGLINQVDMDDVVIADNSAGAAAPQPQDLQVLTQAEYDGLTPVATTLYFIVG